MIDTSPMYGSAETVVGDLVAEMGLRPRVFLATKVWTSGKDAGIAQMRRSAERLQEPGPRPDPDPQPARLAHPSRDVARMKAKGQVRYIGITHYTTGSLPELARILETEPGIDFVQFGYSLATRDAETKLLPVAAARRVATIVNQPFETGDMFRRVRGKPVPEWAAEFDCASWAQLFLKYILAEPAVTASSRRPRTRRIWRRPQGRLRPPARCQQRETSGSSGIRVATIRRAGSEAYPADRGP